MAKLAADELSMRGNFGFMTPILQSWLNVAQGKAADLAVADAEADPLFAFYSTDQRIYLQLATGEFAKAKLGLRGMAAVSDNYARDLMLRAADTLEQVTGVRAVGMRTPSWDFSPNTLSIAMEMGLRYDSSLMADEDCYELLLDGEPSGVIELPVEWVRDDAVYFWMHRGQSFRPYTPPAAVFEIFRREFDAAYDEGGLFQLTMHPHVIGYRSRIWILEELIRHARQRGSVWFATHAEVVEWVCAHAV